MCRLDFLESCFRLYISGHLNHLLLDEVRGKTSIELTGNNVE